jgi:Xaa-Pro aminopeptidase
VGNKYTPEQKILYEIVLKAQLEAIAQVQPGNPYNQFHDTAVRVLVEGLMDLGLLAGDIEEIIKEEKYKPFYMHRTGHWLGLDVHDAGRSLQTRRELANIAAGSCGDGGTGTLYWP